MRKVVNLSERGNAPAARGKQGMWPDSPLAVPSNPKLGENNDFSFVFPLGPREATPVSLAVNPNSRMDWIDRGLHRCSSSWRRPRRRVDGAISDIARDTSRRIGQTRLAASSPSAAAAMPSQSRKICPRPAPALVASRLPRPRPAVTSRELVGNGDPHATAGIPRIRPTPARSHPEESRRSEPGCKAGRNSSRHGCPRTRFPLGCTLGGEESKKPDRLRSLQSWNALISALTVPVGRLREG